MGETAEARRQAPIDPRLLEVLVCPLTRGPLEYDREANELISRKAGLAYPVREKILPLLSAVIGVLMNNVELKLEAFAGSSPSS